MKRREVLKRTAFLTGATLSVPLISSLLSGCGIEESSQAEDYKPVFFKPKELTTLKEIIDVILPKTDSPSASDVGVHQIIDNMIGTVYSEHDREEYRTEFKILSEYLSGEANLLTAVQSIEDKEAPREVAQSYLHLKQQTIAYYLSTEEIGRNHLNYLPVPGSYDACIKLADVGGKAWAL